MLKNKNIIQKGFTIVELLIVIVVIAILAALVLNTFAGVQAKARDSDRQNDISTIDKHLETYHANNGHYPSYGQLSDWGWVSSNLKGLAPAAFYPPGQGNLDENNPTIDTGLFTNATSTSKDNYGYVATHSDGTTACTGTPTTDDPDCSNFTLTWTKEAGDKSVQTVKGLSNE